jgi:hypothetical protein
MANKGTTLHEIRDQFFRGEIESIAEGIATVEDRDYMGVDLEYVTQALQSNADYVLGEMSSSDASGSEVRVENLGTGSGGWLDTWWLNQDKLFVNDLKTGRIEVHANCTQLKRYACGVLDRIGWKESAVNEIHLSISAILFPSSTYVMHINELWTWRQENLVSMMDSAYAIHTVKVAGKHCQWCKAKGVNCNEIANVVDEIVSTSDEINYDELDRVSDSELEEMVTKLEVIKSLADDIKTELGIRYALNEYTPNRLFIKQGRKRSVYTAKAESAIDNIELSVEHILLQPPRLKPVSQLKKLLGSVPDGYKVSHGVEPLRAVLDGKDESILYKPPSYKTKNQLKTLFAHVPSALELIEKGDLASLKDFITSDLLYQPVTPARLKNLVPHEQLDGIVEVQRYDDTFGVVPSVD